MFFAPTYAFVFRLKQSLFPFVLSVLDVSIKSSLMKREKLFWLTVFFRILPYFSRRDDGPMKSNWVREDDDLKQKKQIKMKQFTFQEEYE